MSSSALGKVRVTVSGSSCTCSGFKDIDVVPSRPAFSCSDTVLQLQDELYAAETRDGVALTLPAYATALKALVREKTAAICRGALPPVPVYRIPMHREHSPTFSFLWNHPTGTMKMSSEYGLDAEVVWEYIAALFFLHRACGNMVIASSIPRPDVPAAEVTAASARLRELHDDLKGTLLCEEAALGMGTCESAEN